jgi:hypothetical protein
MTQDEIIEMYLQVSKELCNDTEWCWAGVGEPLQMFAKLVAQAEREACAILCEEIAQESDAFTESILRITATEIRTRGEA